MGTACTHLGESLLEHQRRGGKRRQVDHERAVTDCERIPGRPAAEVDRLDRFDVQSVGQQKKGGILLLLHIFRLVDLDGAIDHPGEVVETGADEPGKDVIAQHREG